MYDLKHVNWNLYWDVFVLRFLFGFSMSVYFANQALYIQEKFKLSQKFIGYTISFVSVIGTLSGLILGLISRKFYKEDLKCLHRLSHSFMIMTVSFIGLYLAPNLMMFYMFLVPFGISNSILRIVSMEAILSKSRDNDKGSLSGVSNSVMSISRFVSPITSGIVADVFGEGKTLLFAFVPSILGTLLCVKLISQEHSKKNR